ncbi:MAG: cupin domain-containing protein [Acidobacteria bacterium]|nr:cupin domain-containing protein [Acidobacteriota bacterium]
MKTALPLVGIVLLLPAAGIAQRGELVWAMKPPAPKYTPPHQPRTSLDEVRKKHAGHQAWRETVVDDEHLNAVWVWAPAGDKVGRRFHPDTRTWWVVHGGRIRFEIEGQQPFVASKGSIVQAPAQTVYSMETVGDQPSLRLEVNIAGARTLYPADAEPPAGGPFQWIKVRLPRTPFPYDRGNKPHTTFEEVAALLDAGKLRGTQHIVTDDRGAANFIYGYEKNLPPLNPQERGHFHPEGAEFWLVMKGQIRYPIENQGVIIANEGDVVYVPKFTFHAPRWYGPGPSCRLAMNGYPGIAHLFEAK